MAGHSRIRRAARFLARAVRRACAALLVTASVSAMAHAQARQRQSPAPETPDLAAAARRIMQGAEYAALITTDASGAPQARTVQPLPPDADWVVWFATNPRTRKVREIARDNRVVLHYFDRATLSYVSVIGRATVIADRRTKDAHWNSAWSAFYPDRDTSVVLIRVVPNRLEIVSSTLGIAGDAATWRPPTLNLPAKRPE